MDHELERTYGLTSGELLDAINSRFRLKVALEGGVAEVQMEKHVAALVGTIIERYETIDRDSAPDFEIWLRDGSDSIRAECKNARNENYASGEYKAEIQKTRAATGDSTSRFYDAEHFEVVGVCLGKQTGDWSHFMFALTRDLERHKSHPQKLAVMHRVPVPGSDQCGYWSDDLATILGKI